MISLTKHDMRRAITVAALRIVSPVVTFRAHVRPTLWCVAVNDDFVREDWH